jgi:hypothetical protein
MNVQDFPYWGPPAGRFLRRPEGRPGVRRWSDSRRFRVLLPPVRLPLPLADIAGPARKGVWRVSE